MKELRLWWKRLNERYAVLSRREKYLLAAALVVGPVLLGEFLIVDPQLARAHALLGSIAQQSATQAELQSQIGSLQQQLQSDPDAAAKAELVALTAEQQRLDDELRRIGTALVRPEEMNGLLESLLARHSGLRLLSLKTLAPQSVLGDKESATDKATGKPVARKFDLYRHGVEIRLEGNYAEFQAYLAQLEQLQQRLLWGQLQYRVIEYPRAEMSLMVYTLSADRTWLAL
jgi:MSHA biogenesis protein MshJ